jgi:fumarylacetoacetate (FAA) hydrolase
MKLASLKSGRDGRLIVVSDDLARYADASAVAPTLQAALDEWESCEPRLREIAAALEQGRVSSLPFHQHEASSPLPRAYQWADGSAYLNHVALIRRARGVEMPESFRSDPLLYQGGSDGFLGPRDPIPLGDPDWGLDFEGEIAVIVDDVAACARRDDALAAIRLVLLVNDVSLRNLIPGELAKGFGFFQSKPASAFSPVAVTPDALGWAWAEGKLSGALEIDLNGRPFGLADAGLDMNFDFPALICHAAKTRALAAGTIIGSGTVSNRGSDESPGRTVAEGGAGFSCIGELRMVETILTGAPKTRYLSAGDVVRIEMKDAQGRSIFGAIEQTIEGRP